MSICRGCGGTGIDASVSPRAAQMAQERIIMRRPDGSGATVRIMVSAEHRKVKLHFSGPLTLVIDHIAQREHDGYRIAGGDTPDRSLACEWCNGYGDPDGQLTAHALEQQLAQP